ncbi:MAG: type II and III secretion system protein [Lentisphaeraceae bacterium]|nr:type II and III secretion system protein [Lentisphaeraceae bacterium]
MRYILILFLFSYSQLFAIEKNLIDDDTLKKVEEIKIAAEEAARLAEEENDKTNNQNQNVSLLEKYALSGSSLLEENEEKEVWTYKCKYIKGSTARRVLEQFISGEGRVGESAESDLIIVHDYKSNLPSLKKIVADLDQWSPQVLVEARVLELNLDGDFERDIKLSYESLGDAGAHFVKKMQTTLQTPGVIPDESSLTELVPYQSDSHILNAWIRFLEEKGRASILSKPNLRLSRGVEGSIITGQEVPILSQNVSNGTVSTSIEFKQVGIQLHVTPVTIDSDRVRIKINPDVSTVIGNVSSADGIENPIIAVRKAKTELWVKNNELISIGGLLSRETIETESRVPFLSAIPLLGSLFRSKKVATKQTQLIIFISLKVLEEGIIDGVSINRPSDIHPAIQKIMDELDELSKEHKEYDLKEDLKKVLDYKE